MQKDVSIGAFLLNGHDSLYSIPAKNVVVMFLTLAQKSINMQSTKFHKPAGLQYSSSLLVWRQYDKPFLAHFIFWLKLSSSITIFYITVFTACIMFWHVHLCFMLPTIWYWWHQNVPITVAAPELFLLNKEFSLCTLDNRCHWQPHVIHYTADTTWDAHAPNFCLYTRNYLPCL